jgi:hypothetical protein
VSFPPHPPGDWVLVLDDVSLLFPPPGSMPTESPHARSELRLLSVIPNPFNPSTAIAFELGTETRLSASIFDSRGRSVRALAAGEFAAGRHELRWDGRDEAGRRVASGAYFVRLQTAQSVQTRKLMLVE